MGVEIGIERTCEQCKSLFNLNPRLGLNWAKKTGRGRFCSDKCSRMARKGIRVSPDTEFKKGQWAWGEHPEFKTGIWSYRKFLKGACEDCNSQKHLFVHHIDHNRENNNLDNLRTVCAKCHANTYHPRKFYGNQYVRG